MVYGMFVHIFYHTGRNPFVIYILFKIMKSASTLRESSLANSWFSKNSSSSVGIPTLYLRSEKSNIYSYFNLFKMKITVDFG